MSAAKVGRNQWCPCGSGKKFKHCHGVKTDQMSLTMKVVLVAAAGVLIAGLVLGFQSFTTSSEPATGMWSEEHNHYH